jgi:DNA-binding MarR family transcriptional regulator
MAVEKLASEAWVAALQFFFVKGRPRMLELWREFDLMPPQQMVLGLLDEPRAMGDLAHQMHCDNSNITGIVDRLTERGLVERRAAEGDRRIKLVALTKVGRELKDELARRRAIAPPEFAELPAADLQHLRRIFTAIAE